MNVLRSSIGLLVLALPLYPLQGVAAGPAGSSSGRAARPVPARIAIALVPGGNLGALLQNSGTTLAQGIAAAGLYLLEAPPGLNAQQVAALTTALQQDPRTLFAELDPTAQPPETRGCVSNSNGGAGAEPCTVAFVDGTPTLGEYTQQSSLATINLAPAQALSRGTSTVVAVVDTGLDLTHPLFAGRLLDNGWDFIENRPVAMDLPNGRDDDHDGWVDEALGHGTHVAGTILLIDPDARILPLRTLDADGVGSAFHVAEAIVFAVLRGADVINLSLSTSAPSLAIAAALEYAELHGVEVVTSAGNTGAENVLFPGNYDPSQFGWILPLLPPNLTLPGANVLCVAAVDDLDVLASFSAWGSEVSLCAPGVGIYSSYYGGTYAWWSGTSMACAVASGAVSLMKAVDDGSYPTHHSAALVLTADPIAAQNPGRAGGLGTGRIDALAAALNVLGF